MLCVMLEDSLHETVTCVMDQQDDGFTFVVAVMLLCDC
jgi:hypothetical protein